MDPQGHIEVKKPRVESQTCVPACCGKRSVGQVALTRSQAPASSPTEARQERRNQVFTLR